MGKLEKKAVFSMHCGDGTTICHDRAFWDFKKYNINPSMVPPNKKNLLRKRRRLFSYAHPCNRDSIKSKVFGEGGGRFGGGGGGGG